MLDVMLLTCGSWFYLGQLLIKSQRLRSQPFKSSFFEFLGISSSLFLYDSFCGSREVHSVAFLYPTWLLLLYSLVLFF